LGSPGRRGRGLPAVGPGKRAPGLIRIPDALLASIAVRPGARDRFVGFVYNGNHFFAYKIDGLSAEAAEGLTVRYQPSDLSADFLTAVRAGEGKLDDHVGHEPASSLESLCRSTS
jgi:hypothetical protein